MSATRNWRLEGYAQDARTAIAGAQSLAPDTKPDLTKLVRAAEDSLRGVLWRDDAQVVRQVTEKRWGEPARVEIAVYAWAQSELSQF